MSARPIVLECVHEAAVLTVRTLQRPLDLLTSCAKALVFGVTLPAMLSKFVMPSACCVSADMLLLRAR